MEIFIKTFLGMFIVLNALWPITWIFTLVKAKKLKFPLRSAPYIRSNWASFADLMMICLWIITLVIFFGYKIGQML